MVEVLEAVIGDKRGGLAIDCPYHLGRALDVSRNRAADDSPERISPRARKRPITRLIARGLRKAPLRMVT